MTLPDRHSPRPSAPPGTGKRRLPMESQTREQQDSSWGKRLVRVVSVRLGDGSRGVFEAPRGVFTPGTTVPDAAVSVIEQLNRQLGYAQETAAE